MAEVEMTGSDDAADAAFGALYELFLSETVSRQAEPACAENDHAVRLG